jgi:hypothetical protein
MNGTSPVVSTGHFRRTCGKPARPEDGAASGVWYREPRTIDVHVRHLREKLERDPKEPEFILTVRGVGYRLRDRQS